MCQNLAESGMKVLKGLLLGVVIGKKNMSKYNILHENDHVRTTPGQLCIK
jgi:hypothetical protein